MSLEAPRRKPYFGDTMNREARAGEVMPKFSKWHVRERGACGAGGKRRSCVPHHPECVSGWAGGRPAATAGSRKGQPRSSPKATRVRPKVDDPRDPLPRPPPGNGPLYPDPVSVLLGTALPRRLSSTFHREGCEVVAVVEDASCGARSGPSAGTFLLGCCSICVSFWRLILFFW